MKPSEIYLDDFGLSVAIEVAQHRMHDITDHDAAAAQAAIHEQGADLAAYIEQRAMRPLEEEIAPPRSIMVTFAGQL